MSKIISQPGVLVGSLELHDPLMPWVKPDSNSRWLSATKHFLKCRNRTGLQVIKCRHLLWVKGCYIMVNGWCFWVAVLSVDHLHLLIWVSGCFSEQSTPQHLSTTSLRWEQNPAMELCPSVEWLLMAPLSVTWYVFLCVGCGFYCLTAGSPFASLFLIFSLLIHWHH